MTEASLIGFIPTRDGDRAKEFYVEVLGLKFERDDGFAMILRSGPNMIRVVRMKAFTPAGYTMLGWETDAIEERVQDLKKKGVRFLRYPYFEQDINGIWTAPGGNKVVWFQDPDGNVLSLSQH